MTNTSTFGFENLCVSDLDGFKSKTLKHLDYICISTWKLIFTKPINSQNLEKLVYLYGNCFNKIDMSKVMSSNKSFWY